jgi:predicted nucleotidyltransferase component of viral defense system
MKKFLKASKADRQRIFRAASDHHGLDVLTIEKDFWVSYLLNILFNHLDLRSRFMFKGGTSLSKCYGLIERFSEDIDLSLHMEDLGFSEDRSPFKEGQSNSALQRIR